MANEVGVVVGLGIFGAAAVALGVLSATTGYKGNATTTPPAPTKIPITTPQPTTVITKAPTTREVVTTLAPVITTPPPTEPTKPPEVASTTKATTPKPKAETSETLLAIGIGVGVVILLLTIIAFIVYTMRKQPEEDASDISYTEDKMRHVALQRPPDNFHNCHQPMDPRQQYQSGMEQGWAPDMGVDVEGQYYPTPYDQATIAYPQDYYPHLETHPREGHIKQVPEFYYNQQQY